MLDATGQTAESAALIEAVLAEDRTHVAALKLRARAAIAADRPDAAIQDMRTALTVAPRDPEVMTIMAFAHERAGDRGLMGERLALAVEVSNRAPEESLRYASFLMQEGRPGPAEGVVVDALRRAPEDPALLGMLGRIHLARAGTGPAPGRSPASCARGSETGDPATTAMATSLDAAACAARASPRRRRRCSRRLGRGAAAANGDGQALADLVRARLAAGEPEEARRAVEAVLADDPASVPARFLLAGLDVAEGREAEAEALYRALVAEAPALPEPHLALFLLLAGRGDLAAAEAALDDGHRRGRRRQRRPALPARRPARGRGDIAGAIADYETLYARSSDSPVVANNLASLLTRKGGSGGFGADPATLGRAYAIARRLRGTEVPEFQDTYGWILLLRGDAAEAQSYLAPAAAALPGNAQVQFHLGEAELALGNREAATAAYEAALAAAGAGSPLPQAETVRARLAEPAAPAGAAPPPAAPAAGGPSGG